MKSLYQKALCWVSIGVLATSTASVAHAQLITFEHDGTNLTGLTIDEPLTFTSQILGVFSVQLRMFDLYPTTQPTYSGASLGAGLVLDLPGSDTGITNVALSSRGDLGGGSDYDLLAMMTTDGPIVFTLSQSMSLTGSASVTSQDTPPFILPTQGTYSAVLTDQNSGLVLTDTIQVQVNSIPEPSTYAALFGAGVLGLVLFKRSRGRKASA